MNVWLTASICSFLVSRKVDARVARTVDAKMGLRGEESACGLVWISEQLRTTVHASRASLKDMWRVLQNITSHTTKTCPITSTISTFQIANCYQQQDLFTFQIHQTSTTSHTPLLLPGLLHQIPNSSLPYSCPLLFSTQQPGSSLKISQIYITFGLNPLLLVLPNSLRVTSWVFLE